MNRRNFLTTSLGVAAALAMPRMVYADHDGWRRYELTYEVELLKPGIPARLWLPLPQSAGDYQRVEGRSWQGNADQAGFQREPVYGAHLFHAAWDKGVSERKVSVVVQVSVRDRAVEGPQAGEASAPAETALFLSPTASMPLDGVVAEKAAEITRGAATPLEKARTIYDWIVDNTFRDPEVKGCGRGDIRAMLESGYLGGKCADLSALYVGLARATGLPAREVYGIRVAESAQFKSLGKSGDISKAQHCRAEVWLPDMGWVPVDPGDVRKAVLEEDLPLGDARIAALRERLFGYWEMNWVGLNHARDVNLAPPARGALSYFMYPHAEIRDEVPDHLDPASFRYRITSREV